MTNLSQNKQFQIHDSIIKYQLDFGIVKKVDENYVCHGKVYYTPRKVVVKETAQTAKLRLVCEASAKSSQIARVIFY